MNLASAQTEDENWESLSLLLSAPSKKAALKCFNRAYVNRNAPSEVGRDDFDTKISESCSHNTSLSQMMLSATASELGITESQAQEVRDINCSTFYSVRGPRRQGVLREDMASLTTTCVVTLPPLFA